jgi:hypothetical protein
MSTAYLPPAVKRPTAPSCSDMAEYLLRMEPHLALRRVSCEAKGDGLLVLRGCVPSYYLKQLAQSTVAHVKGVLAIANEIEVVASTRTG